MTNTKNWNFGADNIEFLSLMNEMIIRDGDGENSTPVCTITIRKRGKVVTPDYLEIGRLIAAAPDLLEAARDLLNWKADSDFYKIAEAKLIAAIAKATGE